MLYWPLAFPQMFAAGGFDCVLGNPPWERIKMQEEEIFATCHRDVAEARNKAERSQRIQWLSEGMLARHLFPEQEHAAPECAAEQRLYAEFITARRSAEAMSLLTLGQTEQAEFVCFATPPPGQLIGRPAPPLCLHPRGVPPPQPQHPHLPGVPQRARRRTHQKALTRHPRAHRRQLARRPPGP